MAAPFTAPITGVDDLASASHGLRAGSPTLRKSKAPERTSRRSKPAQNAGSAPVRTTDRTSEAASASSSAAVSASMSSASKALRTCGRSRTRVRTPGGPSAMQSGVTAVPSR